jgi:hypothetical protein
MNDGDRTELDRRRHVSEILVVGYQAAESGQTIELQTAF